MSKFSPRAKLEGGLENMKKSLQTPSKLFDLAIAMFKDPRIGRLELARAEREEWAAQAKAADESTLELVGRMVETKNATVLKALEAKIERLEREKLVLEEKAQEPMPNATRFEECIELSLRFLAKLWDINKNGSYAVRQTALRLAFSEPLTFTPEGVYGTPKTAIPFKVLGGISTKKCEMVLPRRFELRTSPLPRECSTPELRQPVLRSRGILAIAPSRKPDLDGFLPIG